MCFVLSFYALLRYHSSIYLIVNMYHKLGCKKITITILKPYFTYLNIREWLTFCSFHFVLNSFIDLARDKTDRMQSFLSAASLLPVMEGGFRGSNCHYNEKIFNPEQTNHCTMNSEPNVCSVKRG